MLDVLLPIGLFLVFVMLMSWTDRGGRSDDALARADPEQERGSEDAADDAPGPPAGEPAEPPDDDSATETDRG